MIVRAKDIITLMEEEYSLHLAESWDNSGLQIGSSDKKVGRILIALDLDSFVLKQAVEKQVDMIITHHPLFFKPMKNINYASPLGRMIKALVSADITVYSAHTNLDAAERGLNQALAEKLGLIDIEPLYPASRESLFKLVVYVPATHLEDVRIAICTAGAGYIGNYADCSFRVRGTGTFRPGQDTNPFIGKTGQLEEVDEFRLETIIYERDLKQVLNSMHQAHPYEEVAYDLYRLENEGRMFSPGRKGCLVQKISLQDYALRIKDLLGVKSLRIVGDLNSSVKNVAVISGSGASLMNRVITQNIDLLVTGDLKYHEAKDAEAAGLKVIDAGHQGTEAMVVPLLIDYLNPKLASRNLQVELISCTSPDCIKNI
ncbi:MAG: Nif3-like dinuclear metal center hexameric protein [Syntrophomonadaceae bacterium]|jgi:dinuclear metal center YbgI/SA1388 family protein|nr:Nif3-like dinuclear metal center hexameric protein [Syntrophomonadaceae bacterium]